MFHHSLRFITRGNRPTHLGPRVRKSGKTINRILFTSRDCFVIEGDEFILTYFSTITITYDETK